MKNVFGLLLPWILLFSPVSAHAEAPPAEELSKLDARVFRGLVEIWRKKNRQGNVTIVRADRGKDAQGKPQENLILVKFVVPLVVASKLVQAEFSVSMYESALPEPLHHLLPLNQKLAMAKPKLRGRSDEKPLLDALANWLEQRPRDDDAFRGLSMDNVLLTHLDSRTLTQETQQAIGDYAQPRPSGNDSVLVDLQRWAQQAEGGEVLIEHWIEPASGDPIYDTKLVFKYTFSRTYKGQKEQRHYYMSLGQSRDKRLETGQKFRKSIGEGVNHIAIALQAAKRSFTHIALELDNEDRLAEQQRATEQKRLEAREKERYEQEKAHFLTMLPTAIGHGQRFDEIYEKWTETLGDLQYLANNRATRGKETKRLIGQASLHASALASAIQIQPLLLFDDLVSWAKEVTGELGRPLEIAPLLASSHGGGYRLVFSVGDGDMAKGHKKILFYRRAPTDRQGISAFPQVRNAKEGKAFLRALRRSLGQPGAMFVHEASLEQTNQRKVSHQRGHGK